MSLDITSAYAELRASNDREIEHETAIKWSERACAAFQLSVDSEDPVTKLNYFIWGEDLRHEAIEHSALVGDGGFILNELQAEIDEYRQKAIDDIHI